MICSRLSFDYKKLDYEEIYKGIEPKYWHNVVLSIEDGVFVYALDFRTSSGETQTKLKNSGYILDNIAAIPFSLYFFGEEIILARENHIYANEEDKYNHIMKFFTYLSTASGEIWSYSYDPVEYLGFHTEPFFIE